MNRTPSHEQWGPTTATNVPRVEDPHFAATPQVNAPLLTGHPHPSRLG